MNRVAWIGVFILFLSCGGETQPHLKTQPHDSPSKSIDDQNPFVHLLLSNDIDDSGFSSYSLKWNSNLEYADPILIVAHEHELLIENLSSQQSFSLDEDFFTSLSAGPIQFLNANTRQSLHLEQITSAKVLSEGPYSDISQRDLINCENPSVVWLSASPDLHVNIVLTRENLPSEFKAENIIDRGHWNAGFENGDIYTSLMSVEELGEALFFDILREQISRQLPPKEITWLGSQKNELVKVYVESVQEQNRYLYHFEECP